MKKYDVIVAGYICVDLTPDFRKSETISDISTLFVPGKLIEIEGLSFTLGGAVANTGMALKRFNKKVCIFFVSELTAPIFFKKFVLNRTALNVRLEPTIFSGSSML